MQLVSDASFNACDKIKEGIAKVLDLLKNQDQKFDTSIRVNQELSQKRSDEHSKEHSGELSKDRSEDRFEEHYERRFKELLSRIEARSKTDTVTEPPTVEAIGTCKKCTRPLRRGRMKSSSAANWPKRSKNLASCASRTRSNGTMSLRRQSYVDYRI